MSSPTRANPFSKLDKLDDFVPNSPAAARPEEPSVARTIAKSEERSSLSRLARSEGFTINNFDVQPLPARIESDTQPTFLKTVRIHVGDWNKFQSWCHENRYTHKKGFEMLTAPLPEPKP